MSMVSILAGGVAFVPYAASSVGAIITTTTTPVGLSDSKRITFSCWVSFQGGDGVSQSFYSYNNGSNTRFSLSRNTSNLISMTARSGTDGSSILAATSTTTILAGTGWHHIYVCLDMASLGACKIYIDAVSAGFNQTLFTDANMDLTGSGTWTILHGSSDYYISEFWLNDTYLDDVSKFNVGGRPVNLGPTGAVPIGSQPVYYFSTAGSGNTWATNAGTAGSLTLTGTLGSPTPPP
jgi:hypothetical protein